MKKVLLMLPLVVLLAAGCNNSKSSGTVNEQSTTKPTQMQEQKPAMANWKTYKNAKLGFQISYPPSYRLTENPNDPNHKGSVLFITNQDAYNRKADAIYGQIYIKKTRTSLKAQNNALFNWNLTSLVKSSAVEGNVSYLKYSYFTGSASDSSHTYVLTDASPKTPGDDGSGTGNVLVATVDTSTEGEVGETATPDWIARTMQFVK